ncbi:MAG TPA: 16S rRNA (cytosine(967)-C(5))-methyltransferase RsmB [Pyrinomonadaceae bacterium]|nr:16S rRNA (cytosine(967)-C(5))-methyltransferase RsmB [Pyrinomonadaceae bacterium]
MAKPNSVSAARRAAFEVLRRVEDGAFASVLLASKEENLNLADRALTHELVLGVLRNQLWLDRLADHYSTRKSEQLDIEVRLILRLGLYQLRFLSRVPASAAVNESVNLAGVARKRSAGGFINAVLRKAAVDTSYDPASAINEVQERLAVETSHPNWLIERWTRAFGFEETQNFARANNQSAPVAFRVVHNRADETEVLKALRESGAEIIPSSIAPGAFRITGSTRLLTQLALAGQIYIQDEASQLLTKVLGPKPDERLLDLCAAPGSKTTHIADITNDSAFIVAGDLHHHRLRTVKSSSALQGFGSVNCLTLDGLQPLPVPENYFDRVLIDAPCSGTGTLRRNPEIRWRISTGDIEDLAARQTKLLINAARTVKTGGRLVYSTCSVEVEENERVRQTFLENSKNFKPVEFDIEPALRTEQGVARTWPQRQGSDGFFISAFERMN